MVLMFKTVCGLERSGSQAACGPRAALCPGLMYTLLKQQCLHWLGHIMRMADSQIPKDLLDGELVQGKCPRGRPQLRYKDTCKWDL